MNTYKRIVLSLILMAIVTSLFAQETLYRGSLQDKIDIGKALYKQKKYNAAYIEFDKIEQSIKPESPLYAEASYFKSISALKSNYKYGDQLLEDFLDNFPESPYHNRALFELAKYDFSKKRYRKVIRTFDDINTSQLSLSDEIEMHYQLGTSYLMLDKDNEAATHFYKIKDSNNLYSRPASYYWAHIMYKQEKFDEALQAFRKLENDPTYSQAIPIYVSHIYYKQKRYQDIVNYTVPILHLIKEDEKKELSKLVGDSYFHLENYDQSVQFLEQAYDNSNLITRDESYVLGYSYYKIGSFDKAIPLLTKASKGKDDLAQNAYYSLADSYVKIGNKEKAKTAFGAAADFEFDESIKENALFNYAKLTYELSYSPFNETIKAFDKYIALYPNSERNREAYQILSDVYMVTRNYRDAMSSIEKINPKTNEIKKAYQRVAYLRGIQLYNNRNYGEAIENFDISLQNAQYDDQLNAQALFWKGESYYQLKRYIQSINFFEKFLQASINVSVPEDQYANYNLGYAYFKTENYANAANQFKKFLSVNSGQDAHKIADAYNRLGDYAFLSTNYQQANSYYNKAFQLNKQNADYSLLQMANAQGLLRNKSQKINNLQILLSSYPNSDYRVNALYELGRTYERMGQDNSAKKYYQQIVSNHSKSTFTRKAYLQLGLINYNNKNTQQALKYYKNVVEKYPNSEEADVALMGIKNCYIDLNNVNQYFAYTKKLGKNRTVSTSEKDSITYQAAERLYLSNSANAKSQLKNYISRYPNGSFELNARYYLAELQYKDAEYKDANKNYQFVVNQNDNIFTEEALSRASELTYNEKNYKQALTYFNRLEKATSNSWNRLKANTGQMRSNLQLKQYNLAIVAANKVLKSDVANETIKRDANYTLGKANYKLNNESQALPYLQKVAQNTQIKEGAESKYYVVQILYNQNKKKESENEIMQFIEQGTPFQYWLAESFLLLAKIYEDRGEDFEAKHTLISLFKNYDNDTDGIKNRASEKIIEIENREKAEQKEAQDSSFQLKLIDN